MEEVKTNQGKRKWMRWVKLFLLVYCCIGIAAYYLQEKFLFHPEKVEANIAYKFSQPFKEITIPVDNKTTYSLIEFTSNAPAKGVVLYFHGNKKNVTHYAGAAPMFTSNGYEVWMVDYPGFGKSTGRLTDEALYQQALAVYKMARVRFMPQQIIIYGRSLGTGIATELASVRDCKRLILETPYYSLTSLVDRYLWMYPTSQMIRYKLPTYKYIENVTAPITIFHGTEDHVVPLSNAKKLQPLLKKADEFIVLQGGDHNNLQTFPQYITKMESILQAAH